MKKKIYPLLLVATLSFSACTEVLEPNVDYGGNTFINDYSALVEAVNNLNKSLQERFAALNTLLEKNMATLKLAIDENTGAIKVLSETTGQGLKDINKSLFDGFTSLSNQIDEQGKSIVYAMNTNGEILRLEIEKNGKLISTQILNSTNDLVKAINDQSKSLEERIAALDATLKAGLKDVTVSIDANTKAITLLDNNTQASLTKIDGTLTEGFKMIKQEISDTGDKVIYAMNENGELLRIALDEQQKALSATIVGQTTRLIETINDQTKTLKERFEALQGVIDAGLKKVYLSIDDNTQAITTMDTNVNGNLVKIDGTLTEGFKALKTTMTEQGTAIVGAIDRNGNILRIEIEKNGQVISAQVKESIGDLITAMNNNNTTLVEKIGDLNTIVEIGLADVKGSVNNLTEKIELQTTAITNLDTSLSGKMGELKDALKDLNDAISAGFVAINKTLGGDGTTTVIEAINKNGDILKASIGEDGSLTKAVASVNTTLGELLTAVKALDAKIKDLNDTQTGAATELKEIKNALNSLLAKDGIYNGTDGNLYMTPSAWQLASLDKKSSLYTSVASAAKKVTPTVTDKPTNSSTTTNYYRVVTNENAGEGGVVAVNKGTYSAAGTSEQVYKVVNLSYRSKNVKVVARNINYNIKYSCSDVAKVYSGTATYYTSKSFNVIFLDGETLLENIDVSLTRERAY